jgi:hypothetical protein
MFRPLRIENAKEARRGVHPDTIDRVLRKHARDRAGPGVFGAFDAGDVHHDAPKMALPSRRCRKPPITAIPARRSSTTGAANNPEKSAVSRLPPPTIPWPLPEHTPLVGCPNARYRSEFSLDKAT